MCEEGVGLADDRFAHEGGDGDAGERGGAAQAVLVGGAQAQVETVGRGGHGESYPGSMKPARASVMSQRAATSPRGPEYVFTYGAAHERAGANRARRGRALAALALAATLAACGVQAPTPPVANDGPPVVSPQADKVSGEATFTTTFRASASDPDGNPLTDTWSIDGVGDPTVTGATASVTFEEAHTAVHRADSQAMRWVTDMIVANGLAPLDATSGRPATLPRPAGATDPTDAMTADRVVGGTRQACASGRWVRL